MRGCMRWKTLNSRILEVSQHWSFTLEVYRVFQPEGVARGGFVIVRKGSTYQFLYRKFRHQLPESLTRTCQCRQEAVEE